MATLLRGLRRALFPAKQPGQFGDKELGMLKARAQETLQNMMELKQQREERKRLMQELIVSTLKAQLISIQAAEASVKTSANLTEEQRELMKQCMKDVDQLMDTKMKETFENMDVHMEGHMQTLMDMQDAPPEGQDEMLREMSKAIVSDVMAAANRPDGSDSGSQAPR